MNYQSLTINSFESFIRTAAACFLIFVFVLSSSAQYKGAPVKKDRLLKVLRSKQLQTGDIVSVINSNGVDFRLTAEIKNALIAAGARPEVIRAVEKNQRSINNETFAGSKRNNKNPLKDYEDLLDRAIFSYKDQKNPKSAVSFLRTALSVNPRDPKAYQMLGFVNLYGLNNLPEAERYMRESIEKGGSAVFRVFHDDNGDFMRRCSGSLFISPESIRFESDDNVHTFETSTVNIEKIKLDHKSSKIWKNHTFFKVYLKIGKTEAKFRFAPITGKEEESKMVAQFVQESQTNKLTVTGMF